MDKKKIIDWIILLGSISIILLIINFFLKKAAM